MSMLTTSDEKNIIPTHVVNEPLHNRGSGPGTRPWSPSELHPLTLWYKVLDFCVAWELRLIGSPAGPLLDFLFLLPPVYVSPNNLITCFPWYFILFYFYFICIYFHFILLEECATSIKEIYFQQSGEESKPDAEYSTPGATRGSNCVTNRLHCSYCLQDKVC